MIWQVTIAQRHKERERQKDQTTLHKPNIQIGASGSNEQSTKDVLLDEGQLPQTTATIAHMLKPYA